MSFKDTDAVSDLGEFIREGKILVRKIVPIQENESTPITEFNKAELKFTVNDNMETSQPKYTVSFSGFAKNNEPETTIGNNNAKQAEQTEGKTLCLYLKIPSVDCEEFDRVKNLLEIFSFGNTPVFLHFADTAKTVRLTENNMKLTDNLILVLEDILGKDCVKTAYRKVKKL